MTDPHDTHFDKAHHASGTINTLLSERIESMVKLGFEGWTGTIKAYGFELDMKVRP